MMPRFLKAADAVIAISECTREDAIRLYSVEDSKIQVIYAGVSPRFHPLPAGEIDSVRQKYRLPEQSLLFVGTIEPRKNLDMLLSAVHSLHKSGFGLELVIVGKKGWRSESFFKKRRDLGLEKHVRLAGLVPEEDLPAIYNAASLFVFPSIYEGFGLPVLEAMACGAPVVCSNTSSLPEVAGDAAYQVNPLDEEEFSGAINRVLHDADLRRSMRERGFAQAAKFSWEETARQTLAVYHQFL
jgi:glycosyltransferase involved in cell wall biosynthesis